MAGVPHVQFPEPALEWLVGGRFDPRVLSLTTRAGLPRRLRELTSHVAVMDSDIQRLSTIAALGDVPVAVGRPEALPFASSIFDVIIAHEVMPRLAPGLALPEMARVLRPGGWVAASMLVRDDSVPWVRRFAELMRTADPGAMSDDSSQQAMQNLLTSKYFPRVAQRDFRIWVPINRDELVGMAERRASVARESAPQRTKFLASVHAIFDASARGNELALPYQLRCYRAYVDHAELTTPITLTDDALIIPL